MGTHGATLVPDGATVLTHCNAGALATAGFGTALGVIYAAQEAGKGVSVIACETRPFLQGARLTAWELKRERVPVTLIPTAWRLTLMHLCRVVCVGRRRSHRRNGDVATDGTYAHGWPASHAFRLRRAPADRRSRVSVVRASPDRDARRPAR